MSVNVKKTKKFKENRPEFYHVHDNAKAHQKLLEGRPKDSAAGQNSTVKNKPGDNGGMCLCAMSWGRLGPSG